jgi:hypothetical protein
LRFLRLELCPFILLFLFLHALEHVFYRWPIVLANIFGERVIIEQCVDLYLCNGWGIDEMMGAKLQCRSLAYSGCVRDINHGSMTSFSPRVTTI